MVTDHLLPFSATSLTFSPGWLPILREFLVLTLAMSHDSISETTNLTGLVPSSAMTSHTLYLVLLSPTLCQDHQSKNKTMRGRILYASTLDSQLIPHVFFLFFSFFFFKFIYLL